MISFKVISEQVNSDLIERIKNKYPESDLEFAADNLRLFLEDDDEDTEYAATESHGCLLMRVYDGEYSFIYPFAITDGADPLAAAMEIRAYAVKEEIPLVYTGVRPEEIGELVTNFRHVNIDSSDPENRFFVVRAMSELALLDEIPSYYGYFDIGLTPFMPEDDEDYARLCMDKESNAMWGYDYSEDEPDPDIDYFRESAESEFNRSTALCLAVRYKGQFVGEAILYYFDLLGGADCAVRILPEHRRKGYALEALKTLRVLAKRMGLLKLGTFVDINNTASLAMTEKFLPEEYRDEKIVRFSGKTTY